MPYCILKFCSDVLKDIAENLNYEFKEVKSFFTSKGKVDMNKMRLGVKIWENSEKSYTGLSDIIYNSKVKANATLEVEDKIFKSLVDSNEYLIVLKNQLKGEFKIRLENKELIETQFKGYHVIFQLKNEVKILYHQILLFIHSCKLFRVGENEI